MQYSICHRAVRIGVNWHADIFEDPITFLRVFRKPRWRANALPSERAILSSSGLRMPSSYLHLRAVNSDPHLAEAEAEGSSATGPTSIPARGASVSESGF